MTSACVAYHRLEDIGAGYNRLCSVRHLVDCAYRISEFCVVGELAIKRTPEAEARRASCRDQEKRREAEQFKRGALIFAAQWWESIRCLFGDGVQAEKSLLWFWSSQKTCTHLELQGEGDTTTMKKGIALIVATGSSKEIGRLKLVRGNGNTLH